jgi:hypothetical protein
MYILFSIFTSRPILLAQLELLCFSLCYLPVGLWHDNGAETDVSLRFSPIWLPCTFRMGYITSSGDKASPYFRPF